MRNTNDLRVLERAHQLAVRIDSLTSGPTWRRRQKLVGQLRECAESVPTNITEGAAHSSRKEFARYLQQALASNAETSYHLKFARDVKVISEMTREEFEDENIVVRRMLAKLLSRVREELREPEDEEIRKR